MSIRARSGGLVASSAQWACRAPRSRPWLAQKPYRGFASAAPALSVLSLRASLKRNGLSLRASLKMLWGKVGKTGAPPVRTLYRVSCGHAGVPGAPPRLRHGRRGARCAALAYFCRPDAPDHVPVTRLSPWRDAQLLAQASSRRRDGVQVSRLRAVHQQRASPSERSRHAHALARPKSPDDMVITCAVDGRHGCCLLAVRVRSR